MIYVPDYRGPVRRIVCIGVVLQLLVLVGLAVLAFGCAYLKIERACRDECSEHRGPVMSWSGGPTVPPEAFEACTRACEAKAEESNSGTENGTK